MSTTTTAPEATYAPGDVVNGHVLTTDGTWISMTAPAPVAPKSNTTKIIAGVAAALIVVIGGIAVIGSGSADADTPQTTTQSAPANPGMSDAEIANEYLDVNDDLIDVFDDMVTAATYEDIDMLEENAYDMIDTANAALALPDLPDAAEFNTEWDNAMKEYRAYGDAVLAGDYDEALTHLDNGNEQMADATIALDVAMDTNA